MNQILRQYKLPNGYTDFQKVLAIPKGMRIPVLAAEDFNRMNMLVVAALTMAFENINLKRGMNELQILNLSEAIIDSCGEDNLAFEDLMMFLQGFVRGKYPMSYESMDIPKFMKAFDIYRDERWQEGIRLRDERIAQWQGMGPSDRSAKSDALSEHMSNIAGRLSDMKSQLREQKIADTMKKADQYFKDK